MEMRQARWVLLSLTAIASAEDVELRSLSSRADMVSGGSVLVAVPGEAPVKLSLNGRALSVELHPSGELQLALIEGLTPGKNSLEMQAGKRRGRLELVNHPITGPVFSGLPKSRRLGISGTSASVVGAAVALPPAAGCAARQAIPCNTVSDTAGTRITSGQEIPRSFFMGPPERHSLPGTRTDQWDARL